MKHRIFALFLVLVLLVGVLAGCGKKNNGDSDTSNGNSSIITPTKNDQSQVTSKYAYKPTYLTVPAEVDSVTGVAAKGSTVWFTASIPDGEQTDTYTYTNYRTALYSLDLDSQVCTEVQGDAPVRRRGLGGQQLRQQLPGHGRRQHLDFLHGQSV